jgi:hypothetical protein
MKEVKRMKTMKRVIYVWLVGFGLAAVTPAFGVFEGSSDATFGVPTPSNGTVVYSGVGTNEFRHGQAIPGSTQNILVMDSIVFSTGPDTPFAISHLTYTNGQTLDGTHVETVPVDIEMTFTDPAGLVETFDFEFDFDLTPNTTGDPVLDADTLRPVDVNSQSDTVIQVGGNVYTLELIGFSSDGGSTIETSFILPEDATTESDLYAQITPPIVATLDIKPGSYPNSINLRNRGVVPVAVLTTEDFDATTIDPDTVEFAGATPVRWTLEDVDGDGDTDMLFHFNTQDLNLNGDSEYGLLIGRTTDGDLFAGIDTVNIVPRK